VPLVKRDVLGEFLTMAAIGSFCRKEQDECRAGRHILWSHDQSFVFVPLVKRVVLENFLTMAAVGSFCRKEQDECQKNRSRVEATQSSGSG
ncbi:MAG: hypothetical protein AAF939_10230, partial [Planctomycetota bacterium]